MLTTKQEQFVQNILQGMNQTEAYRSAYPNQRMSDKTMQEAASRLMGNSKVIARLKEIRDINARPTIMTAQKRKEWLTEVINNEEIDINARLKASDQLNKMEGEYVQKVEAEVKREFTINIELVDDDEC